MAEASEEERRERYLQRVRARMARMDELPAPIRVLIHAHGYTVVDAFLQAGVRKAKQITHLIAVVREGSDAYGDGARTASKRPCEP